MTQQLSPIAQVVQFAAFRVYDEEEHLYVVPAEKHAGMIAAAALRAAADHLTPYSVDQMPGAAFARHRLQVIARELENYHA